MTQDLTHVLLDALGKRIEEPEAVRGRCAG
jgi:hypothetical protein